MSAEKKRFISILGDSYTPTGEDRARMNRNAMKWIKQIMLKENAAQRGADICATHKLIELQSSKTDPDWLREIGIKLDDQ